MNKDDLKQELDVFAASLMKHLNRRFDEIDQRFDETDRKFSQLQSSVDEIHHMVEIERDERTAIMYQLDRHETWIQKAAAQMKVDYDHAA